MWTYGPTLLLELMQRWMNWIDTLSIHEKINPNDHSGQLKHQRGLKKRNLSCTLSFCAYHLHLFLGVFRILDFVSCH